MDTSYLYCTICCQIDVLFNTRRKIFERSALVVWRHLPRFLVLIFIQRRHRQEVKIRKPVVFSQWRSYLENTTILKILCTSSTIEKLLSLHSQCLLLRILIVITHYDHINNSILITNFPNGISDVKYATWSLISFMSIPLVMSSDVKCDVHSFFCVRPFESAESGQVDPRTSCLPIISTYIWLRRDTKTFSLFIDNELVFMSCTHYRMVRFIFYWKLRLEKTNSYLYIKKWSNMYSV